MDMCIVVMVLKFRAAICCSKHVKLLQFSTVHLCNENFYMKSEDACI